MFSSDLPAATRRLPDRSAGRTCGTWLLGASLRLLTGLVPYGRCSLKP